MHCRVWVQRGRTKNSVFFKKDKIDFQLLFAIFANVSLIYQYVTQSEKTRLKSTLIHRVNGLVNTILVRTSQRPSHYTTLVEGIDRGCHCQATFSKWVTYLLNNTNYIFFHLIAIPLPSVQPSTINRYQKDKP